MSTETMDGLRALHPARLFFAELLEHFIRMAGWVGAVVGKDREGVELVLRGRILGGRATWRVGRNVRFVGACRQFRLGKNVCLYGNSYFNAGGPSGAILIGADSHVDQLCVLYGQGRLEIGSSCAIASGVIIYSQTNADTAKDGSPVAQQPTSYAPVKIGNGCWLGAGGRIIPGVTLGDGCHVGAGAVVTGDLPPFSVAVGVPAKVIKQRAK